MASRQNYPQLVNNNNQTTATTTTQGSSTTANVKEKSSSHSSKSDSAKMKNGKVIHKYTSESYLRLICEKSSSSLLNEQKNFIDKSSSSSSTSGHVPLSSNTIINNMSNKRKGTSFQITSVSVSSANVHHHHQMQRNSTDNNGDDSADDLDDSHTDDNISRITDYETPSISETFSGEDVFFAQQNAFGTAPVIPTSSQYGLAIVGPPDLACGNGTNLSDVHVSVTDAGINIMGPISSKQDPDHKNERFKVVKIESTEPFKRGRWMCMDYLDHTTTLHDDGTDGATKDDELQHEVTGPKVLIVNNGEIERYVSDNEELDHEVNKINSSGSNMTTSSNDIITTPHQTTQHTSHPQTMTSIPTFIDHSLNTNAATHANQSTSVAQSFPVGQIEKMITHEKQLTLNLQHENSPANTHLLQQQAEMLPQSSLASESNISNTSQQSQIGGSISQQQQHAQTMSQEMIQNSIMHQDQQQLHNFHQGATLPTNILMQNIDPQQQSQLNSPNSSNVLPSSISIQQQQQAMNINENVALSSTTAVTNPEIVEFSSSDNNNNINQEPMTSQFQPSPIVTGDRIQSESDSNQQQQTGSLVTNENIINNLSNNSNSGDNNTVSNDGTQQNIISSPSSSAGTGTVVEGAIGGCVSDINESASVNSGNNNNSNATGGSDDAQAEDNER